MAVPAIAPRWELYSHDADIGIRGIGSTVSEAFTAIGLALTAAVCEPSAVDARTPVAVRCSAPDIETLLYEWVNTIIFEMAVRRMLFSRYEVRVDGDQLSGTLWGEPLDLQRHQPAVEVKGATYTDLHVRQDRDGAWVAQCIIDV